MKSANNLKELSMDNSMFFDYHNEADSRSEKDADDTVVSKTLLFYKCSSKILERVSLRNSRFSFYSTPEQMFTDMSHKALSKFIRNAPTTMRWVPKQFNQGRYRDLTTGTSRN